MEVELCPKCKKNMIEKDALRCRACKLRAESAITDQIIISGDKTGENVGE